MSSEGVGCAGGSDGDTYGHALPAPYICESDPRPGGGDSVSGNQSRSARDRLPRRNEQIRAEKVRVVAPDGSQIGVKTLEDALWLAEQLGLDLVEVAPNADPPVAKIMDWGKFRYEQQKQERAARRAQAAATADVKEVRLSLRIADHDLDVMRRRAVKFLTSGDKVRVTLRLKGREVSRPQNATAALERFIDLVRSEVEGLVVEEQPRLQGQSCAALLSAAASLPAAFR